MNASLAEPLESVDACGSAVAVGVLPGVHEEVVVARLLEVLEVAVRLRRREDTHEPRRLRELVLGPEIGIEVV